jgi:hypothetical protein
VAANFLRGKLAPLPGGTLDVLGGRDMIGQPVSPLSAAGRLVTPLAATDIYQAMNDLGVPRGAAVSLYSLLGGGVNVHQPRVRNAR